MIQLLCRDLILDYDQKNISGCLNFEVNTGDYLCIIGGNGSGKSMLMGTILGLQPPLIGVVEHGDGLHANKIGYLPQQALVQRNFPASVEEIMLSGRQGRTGFWPFYRKTSRENVEENMEHMGIAAFRKRYYRELSGEQQQCMLLARALYVTEKIPLLGEPILGLDPRVTVDMYRLIQGLSEKGITIIIISHDIAAVVQYTSHILRIDKKVFFGTREEYQHSWLGERFLQEESVNT